MASIADIIVQAAQFQFAGNLAQAEHLYEQVLQAEPGNANALHQLAFLAHQTGRLPAACEHLRKAVAIYPTIATFHINLGLVLKDQGKLDEAIDCYRDGLDRDPNNPDAHNNLGNALKAQGRLTEAITCYRQALAINPNLPNVLNNLGIALSEQKKLDEALGRGLASPVTY